MIAQPTSPLWREGAAGKRADHVGLAAGARLDRQTAYQPGDRVLVEAPTYLGALQAFNVYGAEYLSVPSDDDGMRTDLLEKPLRSGPKFMYVLPNFHNPGGTTLTEGRRHELVLLADRYGVPIVEDDPYGQLRYEGEHLSRWSRSIARTCAATTATPSAT